MVQHFFKLIWNKRGSHALLIIEILAAFLVLFGVMGLISYEVNNYLKPIGFKYEQVWLVNINYQDLPDSLKLIELERMKTRILDYPQVAAAGLSSGNTPFSNNQSNSDVSYKKTAAGRVDVFSVDEQYAQVMTMPVESGKWFGNEEMKSGEKTIIINHLLEEKLLGDESALGKKLTYNKESYRVVGVVEHFKQFGEFQAPIPSAFFPYTVQMGWLNSILIKVRPGTDASFEAQMIKELGAMSKGANIEVSYLTDQRKNTNTLILIPVLVLLIISGFLLFNVALGLFGMLNLSIAKRKAEIGLRRALGATRIDISRQFVGEMVVLASFSIALGFVLAIQFPLLKVFNLPADVYIAAILLAIGITYSIVLLCAFYPSREAAKIQPAIALHEG
jgi:putative ABC transport system permease protein